MTLDLDDAEREMRARAEVHLGPLRGAKVKLEHPGGVLEGHLDACYRVDATDPASAVIAEVAIGDGYRVAAERDRVVPINQWQADRDRPRYDRDALDAEVENGE